MRSSASFNTSLTNASPSRIRPPLSSLFMPHYIRHRSRYVTSRFSWHMALLLFLLFKSSQHTSFVFSLHCQIQSSTLLHCVPYPFYLSRPEADHENHFAPASRADAQPHQGACQRKRRDLSVPFENVPQGTNRPGIRAKTQQAALLTESERIIGLIHRCVTGKTAS